MPNFKEALQNFGFGVAGQAINTGLGIVFGNKQAEANDARQLAMQAKLQQMQEEGSKRMVDYNYGKQLQMWKDTNYPAQKEQLLKAGLNPALFYGMSGGGGTTTGSPTGSVSAGQAPSGGGEQQTAQGMGIQMQSIIQQSQLLKAQENLLEAQTENVKADTTKKSGVDTEAGWQGIIESDARTQSILQGTDNARQQHELNKLDITLKNMINFEQQATQADRMDYIEYQTKIAMKQLDNATTEAFLNKQTVNDKIKIIQQEAIGAALSNALTKAQTTLTREQTKKVGSDIQLNNNQMRKITNEIMMGWDSMDQKNKEIFIKEQLMWNETDPVNNATRTLTDAIDNIFIITRPHTKK